MIKLKFLNNDNAHLMPECESELFRNVEWKEEGVTYLDEPNTIWKRRATAQMDEDDSIAFGNTLFYGHVLVSQEKQVSIKEDVVGKSTNIVPMDDAKIKTMQGRSGYYGTGTCSLGSNPVN